MKALLKKDNIINFKHLRLGCYIIMLGAFFRLMYIYFTVAHPYYEYLVIGYDFFSYIFLEILIGEPDG